MFIFLYSSFCICQEERVYTVAGVYNDTLMIRWLPSNSSLYKSLLEREVCIAIIPWNSTNSPKKSDFEKFPSKKSFKLNSLQRKLELDSGALDTSALVLSNGVVNMIDSNGQQLLYANLLMYAISKPKIAFDLNFGFNTVKPFDSEFIAYRIYAKEVFDQIGITTSSGLHNIRFDSLKIYQEIEEVSLIWNNQNLSNQFSSYNVWRSQEKEGFEQINTTPVFHLATDHEINKSTAKYVDKEISRGKEYSYYLEGVDHFGNKRGRSNIVKVKIPNPLGGSLLISNIKFGHLRLEIDCKYTNYVEEDLCRIREVLCYLSYGKNSDYKRIKSQKLDSTVFKINAKYKSDQVNGLIKVALLTNDSDTLWSQPKYFFVRDSVPPDAPENLKGIVDSSGLVQISWDAVNDDLMGYRIFRKNSKGEEFIEITEKFVETNFYVDSISLDNLTNEIYYSISATDQNYNRSKLSKTLKLTKPDLIPPVPSFFTKSTIYDEGVMLYWSYSSSKDVQEVHLEKIIEDSLTNVFKTNKDTSFLDVNVESGSQYLYRLKTYDNSGNMTESEVYIVTYELGYRRAVSKIRAEANREEHFIQIDWENTKNVYATYIYLAREEGKFRLEKSLFSGETNFQIKNLPINNTYHFKIQTMDQKGILSKMSKTISIDY